MTPEQIAARAGVEFFDYQEQALAAASTQPGPAQRRCLFYKTGAGKSITSLAMMQVWGHGQTLVVAPPSTHETWKATGNRMGISVVPVSHAKFRQKDFALSRNMPVIADEMHLFGGHKGQGWKKLERLARGLKAPLVLASATPNYNDAERVYCIERILDPVGTAGGYIAWLYKHCTTEQNPFGMEPIVTGFHRFAEAKDYLAALPLVDYLPDDLVWSINDITIPEMTDQAFEVYGYDDRRHRIMASQIEERHARVNHNLVAPNGMLWLHVYEELVRLTGESGTPALVYCNHSTVATALSTMLSYYNVRHGLVTGATPKTLKQQTIERFIAGKLDVLVGTASLATGTDGMDKMCDLLVILDDTDDDSLRRQLVGRIMPRGADTDASRKQVYRFVI